MDGLPQVLAAMPGSDTKNQIAQIFRAMSERLRRFVRARVRIEADAEDVLQEVWQQFIAALEVRPVEQTAAWLYTVARNRIIDRQRKARPASLEELAGDSSADTDADENFSDAVAAAWLPRDEKTPATEHFRAQFWEQLHAALAELPPEQRQVFIWHELEALSFQDIAELTGENLNTLLARKRYAVLHLRKRLRVLRDDMLPEH
jgi:RNA polymerase sigma factor (sigma-70 family)